MSPLVEADGLAIPGRLAPARFRIDGPQLVALIGPNGSGKTSLLHALAGIGGAEGDVRIGGLRPADLGPGARKRLLAFLPAGREAAWPMRVRDLVRLGLPDAAPMGEEDPALEALDLCGLADRRLDRLSTGERSRALIARALAPDPKLLLLDEPTANLDPYWQLSLMALVRARVAAGSAGLVAMHDLDLAARFADRLVLMSAGRIVLDAEPEAVLASGELGAAFAIERVDGAWRALSRPADPRSSP